MALTATCIHEVRSGGSDTAAGGAFDPSQTAGMFTDGAATSATGNSPVFSSASYNFVAGDVGAKVYIASGSNWTPGWYEIASVATNVATLKAAVGEAFLVTFNQNTAAGCATTASPTGATWTIDYSQQDAAAFTYTDITYVTGTTFTSAGNPFGKQQVGNVVRITGGTNFTAGYYIITSVTGTTATFNATACSGASSNGAGNLGGAYATPGYGSSRLVDGNAMYVKAATYTTTSTTAGASGGPSNLTTQASIAGYTTVRGDRGQFTLKCGAALGARLFQGNGNGSIENAIADGNSVSSSGGFNGNATTAINCTAKNMAFEGFNCAVAVGCYATACTGSAFNTTDCRWCYAAANPGGGFSANNARWKNCIAYNNTGVGFAAAYDSVLDNCVAISNSSHGITDNGNTRAQRFINCVLVSNGGYGISMNANRPSITAYKCAFYNNTSGAVNNLTRNISAITLTGDPFTNAAGGDFSLDNTASEGASLRAAGFPGVWNGPASTTDYRDIGAVQHQDSGGGSASILCQRGMNGGFPR